MINIFEVNETNKMIEQENLDVRTITMGISLLDCIDSDLAVLNEKIYKKQDIQEQFPVKWFTEISAIKLKEKRMALTFYFPSLKMMLFLNTILLLWTMNSILGY